MINSDATPVAVSGLRNAEKIRVVIYANNRFAHVPLPEILKWAAESKPESSSGNMALLPNTFSLPYSGSGGCVVLAEKLLLQYGFAAVDSVALAEGRAQHILVRFPQVFATEAYCPQISVSLPCAAAAQHNARFAVQATVMAQSLRKTGFDVCLACRNVAEIATNTSAAAADTEHDNASSAADCSHAYAAGGIFWLAIGLSA